MASPLTLKRLFEPLRIGTLELRNRIIMPPMATNFPDLQGHVTERMKAYYEARARGGASLIIVESAAVNAVGGKARPCQLTVDDDRCISGLAELAQVIQRQGARAMLQLHCASPAPQAGGTPPEKMPVEELTKAVVFFARAAERARKAGFDGVEVHGAGPSRSHYLLSRFLSRAMNTRHDGYGGSLENRARLLLEVVGAVKEAVGPGYPVWCRINGEEARIPGGTTVAEAQAVARMLQDLGVEVIDVISQWGPVTASRPMCFPLGWGGYAPARVKEAVRVPVVAGGRIDVVVGEQLIEEGKADLIAIGRALVADPEIPNKARSGRLDDIVPCTSCNSCRDVVVLQGLPWSCMVNPLVGREGEPPLQRAPRSKKVMVVGGGPGGMEAAWTAALRGHQVTLYEKTPHLGGQLALATIPPYKDGLPPLARFLESQVKKAGVRVVTGQEVTPSLVDREKPDAVVVATGVVPFIPDLPGIRSPKVVLATDVLAGEAPVGEKVVVLGGELVGCEVAEYLVDRAKKVAVTRRGPEMATKVPAAARVLLLERLESKGVRLLPGVKYQGITERGLAIVTREGRKITLEADTIVLATGARPEAGLAGALKGKACEVYLAGDCVEPRGIREAIHEGFQVGQSL